MKNYYSLILTVFVLLSAANSAAEEEAVLDFNCDITDEQTVYWAALSQAVTLKTQIKHEGEVYPQGIMTLILEDGTEVDLGGGRKYIDDAPDDEFFDCNNHLEIAKTDTLESLSGALRFDTLESLWAYSAMGQDCMDQLGSFKQGASGDCSDAINVHEGFIEASSDSSLSFTQFKRLRDSLAPLITIRRSKYYKETFVYDEQTKSLHKVLTEGC